jgi:putative endonuclease
VGRRAPGAPPQRDARSLSKGLQGGWAEDAAARHLQRAGLKVIERNWRCRGGEIDLVARDPDGTTVFVEVKQRATSGYGSPGEFIGPRKADLVRRAALAYLRRDDLPCRFDAILVEGTEGSHRITWLEDAF